MGREDPAHCVHVKSPAAVTQAVDRMVKCVLEKENTWHILCRWGEKIQHIVCTLSLRQQSHRLLGVCFGRMFTRHSTWFYVGSRKKTISKLCWRPFVTWWTQTVWFLTGFMTSFWATATLMLRTTQGRCLCVIDFWYLLGVAFSSHVEIMRKGWMNHTPPALFVS